MKDKFLTKPTQATWCNISSPWRYIWKEVLERECATCEPCGVLVCMGRNFVMQRTVFESWAEIDGVSMSVCAFVHGAVDVCDLMEFKGRAVPDLYLRSGRLFCQCYVTLASRFLEANRPLKLVATNIVLSLDFSIYGKTRRTMCWLIQTHQGTNYVRNFTRSTVR